MKTNIQAVQLFFVIAILLLPGLSRAEATNARPVVVEVKFQNGKASYEIESRSVRSELFLEALGVIIRRRGREARVIVIVDSRNPISTLDNARGIVSKVGFSEVHYFVMSAETQRMAEITLDHPAVPYSLNPETAPQRRATRQ
ncbi:MAG: hypothetical protein HOP33_16935 [Verrucomicrobia bacterium]|nr:hypothetical protein [Verrucomicrobiota bacterium]